MFSCIASSIAEQQCPGEPKRLPAAALPPIKSPSSIGADSSTVNCFFTKSPNETYFEVTSTTVDPSTSSSDTTQIVVPSKGELINEPLKTTITPSIISEALKLLDKRPKKRTRKSSSEKDQPQPQSVKSPLESLQEKAPQNSNIIEIAGSDIKIISYCKFLEGLKDIKSYESCNFNRVGKAENSLVKYEYNVAMTIYFEGFKKLIKCIFKDEADAILSVKTVLRRAFNTVSISSRGWDGNQLKMECSHPERGDKGLSNKVTEYFNGHFAFECSSECTWYALLEKDPSGTCFYFSEISPLTKHKPPCFTRRIYITSDYKELATRRENCNKFDEFNDLLITKVGIKITSEALRKKRKYLEKKDGDSKETVDFIKVFDNEVGLNDELDSEDKAIIGKMIFNKQNTPGFEYRYGLSLNNKLVFLTYLWPEQKEMLATFGDLIFIDSTFGLDNRDFKAINLIVVNGHYKSVLGGVAFVKSECNSSYYSFLSFIKEKVCFRRLPLCLISDGAQVIHSSVAKVFPYAKHIYCSFHLAREGKIFDDCKDLDKATKDKVIELLNLTLNTKSLITEDKALDELKEIVKDEKVEPAKEKIETVMGHGINGSKALQEIFSANTVASSRAESMNSNIKKEDVNRSVPLIDTIDKLDKVIKDRLFVGNGNENKVWNYVSNSFFLECFESKPTTITDEVLEMMLEEFILLTERNYKVTKISDEIYNVQFVEHKPRPLTQSDSILEELKKDGKDTRSPRKVRQARSHS